MKNLLFAAIVASTAAAVTGLVLGAPSALAQSRQAAFTHRAASILAMAYYATEAQTCGLLGAPYTLGDVNAAADSAANDAADLLWGTNPSGPALTAKMAALHGYYEASARVATQGMFPAAAECQKISGNTALVMSIKAFLGGQ